MLEELPCDSIVTLDLTINNSVSGTDTQVACGSYTWIDGNTYTASNNSATFTLVGGAVSGCDSIVTLDLTISNSVSGTDTQVACESYTWIDGNTYTASNNSATFTLVGGAVNGCDSIVALDLTINNSVSGIDVKWLVVHLHGLMEIPIPVITIRPLMCFPQYQAVIV